MKQLRKVMMLAALVAMTCLFAACGTDTAEDGATEDTEATGMQEDDLGSASPDADSATEDATERATDNADDADDVLDDVGDDIESGVDDVIDGVEDAGDDVTDDGAASTNP